MRNCKFHARPLSFCFPRGGQSVEKKPHVKSSSTWEMWHPCAAHKFLQLYFLGCFTGTVEGLLCQGRYRTVLQRCNLFDVSAPARNKHVVANVIKHCILLRVSRNLCWPILQMGTRTELIYWHKQYVQTVHILPSFHPNRRITFMTQCGLWFRACFQTTFGRGLLLLLLLLLYANWRAA